MPKAIDVAKCVATQLRYEGRWPPNDLNKVMGTNYHYTSNTLALFLVGVQQRLQAYQPPYTFTFDAKFASACVPLTVGELIGKIDGATTSPIAAGARIQAAMQQGPKARRPKQGKHL